LEFAKQKYESQSQSIIHCCSRIDTFWKVAKFEFWLICIIEKPVWPLQADPLKDVIIKDILFSYVPKLFPGWVQMNVGCWVKVAILLGEISIGVAGSPWTQKEITLYKKKIGYKYI